MQKEIKYTYIAKNKSTDAILTNLTHSLKTFDEYINGYRIFDDINYGIRIYPDIIQENVEVCSKDDLINKIEECIDDEIDLILLNGFDIDLDEIKDVYAKIVDDSDIMLCINRLYDVKENVSVTIDPSIHKLNEEKWLPIKEEIEESMLDVVEECNDDDFSLLKKITPVSFKGDNDLDKLLKSLFEADIDKSNKLDNIIPDVTYSQVLQDKELHITKTINGDIVIDNEIDMITIEKDQIDFFINTITNLIK